MFLRQFLRQYFPMLYDYDGGNMIIDQCVSTVSTVQGLENWLVVYNPGRGQLQNRQVGSNSLIDRVFDLSVLSMNAKQHVIYLEIMD